MSLSWGATDKKAVCFRGRKQRVEPARQKSCWSSGSAGINSWFGLSTPDSVLSELAGLMWCHTLQTISSTASWSSLSSKSTHSNPIESAHYPNTFNWFGHKTQPGNKRVTLLSTQVVEPKESFINDESTVHFHRLDGHNSNSEWILRSYNATNADITKVVSDVAG